jgi:hypothetical protein
MAQMPKNRIIIVLGILVALQPFIGFPQMWEFFLQISLGILIVLFSTWATIDKRLTLKAKAQKRQLHKQREKELEMNRQSEADIFISEDL